MTPTEGTATWPTVLGVGIQMIGAAGEQSEIDGWCEAPDDGMRTIWERGHDVDTLRSNLSIEFDAVGLAVAEFANGGADAAGGSPGNLVLGDEQGGSISFETMAFVAPATDTSISES